MPLSPSAIGNMRQFQIRLLRGILLANVAFELLLLAAGAAGLVATPGSWSLTLGAGTAFMAALCGPCAAGPRSMFQWHSSRP